MDSTGESNSVSVAGTSHNGPRVRVEGAHRVWGHIEPITRPVENSISHFSKLEVLKITRKN